MRATELNGTERRSKNKTRCEMGNSQQSTPLLASSRHRSGQGIYKGKRNSALSLVQTKELHAYGHLFSVVPQSPTIHAAACRRNQSAEDPPRLDSGSAVACAGRTPLPIAAARITERTPASRCARKQHPLPPSSPSRLPRRRRHGPEVGDDDGDNYSCAHHVPTHSSALLPPW
jgi:hypothetical protein